MSMNALFVEENQIQPAIIPVNLATGANNGDWFPARGFSSVVVIFLAGVGAASQDPTLTLEQATSDGGSGKAINFTRLDVKQASALTSVGTFTTVTQAAGNTYTEATSGEKQKLWVVEVKSADFDSDNGYDWLRASIADTGSTSQIGCALYIGRGARYAGADLPSGIA